MKQLYYIVRRLICDSVVIGIRGVHPLGE